MKALSLFSGIGGIDLAGEWAGIETVAFCEREPFCQKVLKKHWPHVPIYDDVCTLTKERLEQDGIGTIDLIHGGYPCQPFSLAGKREGAEDDRHLWPEVFRLLQKIKPKWFVGENVAGHVTLGLDIVLSDLESIGYTREAFIIPACAVNAPHRRDRVFIVAYSNGIGDQTTEEYQIDRNRQKEMQEWFESQLGFANYFEVAGYANSKPKSQTNPKIVSIRGAGDARKTTTGEHWRDFSRSYWEVYQPPVCGVDDGISDELDEDRNKALGNAVVPQQIYPILAAIKQIYDMMRAS